MPIFINSTYGSHFYQNTIKNILKLNFNIIYVIYESYEKRRKDAKTIQFKMETAFSIIYEILNNFECMGGGTKPISKYVEHSNSLSTSMHI